MRLNNKVAVVTGGASGMGRAISLAFSKEGAEVVIADVNLVGANEVAKEIKNLGRKALAFKVDVRKAKDIDNMVTSIIEKFGKVDILVNDAGIFLIKPITQTTEEEWDRIVDVNLKGMFLCSKRIIPEMISCRRGKIINIASISAELVNLSYISAYIASKSGVIGLTKAMAQELAPNGINVNAIGPGTIETPMTLGGLSDPEIRRANIALVPQGRLGQPEDIATVAVFLASDESNYITGQTIFVDGGYLTTGGILTLTPK